MYFTPFFTPLLLTLSPALAAENLIHNNCAFDVWFTSVSSGTAPTPDKLPAGAYVSEAQYFDGTGTAIKITRDETGLYTHSPVLHFSYSYKEDAEVYYDLSSEFGFDFWGFDIALNASAEGAPDLLWSGQPKPNFTARYGGETDLELTLCA